MTRNNLTKIRGNYAFFRKNQRITNIDGMRDISYITGHKAAIVELNVADNSLKYGIKIWNSYQYVSSQSVHDILRNNTSKELRGQQAIVMYSLESITIDAIDRDKDERSMMDEHQSFGDYISNKYHISKLKQEHNGLIAVKKRDHTAFYLPQFVHLKIDSRAPRALDAGIKISRSWRKKQEAIESRQELVQMLSSDSNDDDNKEAKHPNVFNIDKAPIVTKGYLLPTPWINMHVNGRQQAFPMNAGLNQWKNISGCVEKSKTKNKWHICIVGHHSYSRQQLENYMRQYIDKRGFSYFDRKTTHMESMEEFYRNQDQAHGPILLFIIIPNDVQGSHQKRKLHRECIKFKHKLVTQFIREMNVSQFNKVMNAMDDNIYKIGESLYEIMHPMYENDLILGFDVNHVTNTIRPSVGVMSCTRQYFIPNKRRITSAHALLNHKQEILSREDSKKLAVNVLAQQLKRIKKLPHAIWYLRDGVSESQFNALQTESEGIKDAIQDIKQDEKFLKDKYVGPKLKEWQPVVPVVVIQKRISDQFVAKKDSSHAACIIPLDVVSHNVRDFYLRKGAQHPLRIIFLSDPKECVQSGNIMDCANFFHQLLYSYPFGMPRKLTAGTTRIPSCIKWCDKWAQSTQEMITPYDELDQIVQDFSKLNIVNTATTNRNYHREAAQTTTSSSSATTHAVYRYRSRSRDRRSGEMYRNIHRESGTRKRDENEKRYRKEREDGKRRRNRDYS